jgi:pimeloyl-ACP methyl ester carboxylesterase
MGMRTSRDLLIGVDDPQSFDHRFATVNGIRIHFVEEGKGPLVLLAHGYPFLWYLWRHQIKAVAAAGYRVVALDQRGYGQTDCPQDVDSYDLTHLAGDVVGLMKALDSKPAVLVGQDWGTIVVYYTALMRPDLVRGVVMMCSPPTARGAVRPSDAMEQIFNGLNFYQSYFATTEASTEIMRDLRRFLLGVFYSTSGYCPADKQWRWAWKSPETFSDTYIVPETLPPHLSQQALDYYVGEFTRTGSSPQTIGIAPSTRAGRTRHSSMGRLSSSPHFF